MTTEITYIDNDTMIKVTVTEDGFSECGFISSQHLVDTKVNQLKAVIHAKAVDAITTCQGYGICDI